jgi:hypothetical protein
VIDHETQSLEVVTLRYLISTAALFCCGLHMNAAFFSGPLSIAMANEQGMNGVGKSGSIGELKLY